MLFFCIISSFFSFIAVVNCHVHRITQEQLLVMSRNKTLMLLHSWQKQTLKEWSAELLWKRQVKFFMRTLLADNSRQHSSSLCPFLCHSLPPSQPPRPVSFSRSLSLSLSLLFSSLSSLSLSLTVRLLLYMQLQSWGAVNYHNAIIIGREAITEGTDDSFEEPGDNFDVSRQLFIYPLYVHVYILCVHVNAY